VKILFDQGTPVPLRRYLTNHTVQTVYELRWSTLDDGAVLTKAEHDGFNVLVTTDQNLRYQQNLTGRKLAIVVIKSTAWPKIFSKVSGVVAAIENAKPGSFTEVPI